MPCRLKRDNVDVSQSGGSSVEYRRISGASDHAFLLPPQSVEEENLRTELNFFFLSSIQKWKRTGDVSYSIVIQMLKIIIVTAQLVLLGSLSMSRVTYGERSAMTFKHLYLNSWDPQYETLPYPPSTGVYALYTREAFYEAIGFALRKYNATEAVSLNGYAFTDPLRPVTVCAEIFNSVRSTGYRSELDRDKVCRTFNLLHVDPIDVADAEHTEAFLNSKDLGIAFSRFSRLWLNFSLASPPVHHMDWDRSVECFQFAIRVIFENAGQTGQVVGALDAELIEMACVPTGGSEMPLTSRRVVHLIVDVFAFNVALVSLLLCGFSLYRALNLWKRTVRFFRDHCGQQLSGMLKQFLDVWIFIVACGDLLIICGSSLKFVHSQDILSAYAELAYLLGMGTLVVWVSALRFVEFSSRTHLLLRTLRRSMPSLVRFLTCALVLFFAFVFPAWVILGPFNMKFRTLTATLECLFSLINGDDMYVTFSIIDWSRGIGIFLFSRLFLYSFISLFIYTVLNIFVTIIFEAYEEAKERESFDSEEMGILKQFLAKRVGEQSPEAGTCDSAYEDINRPISGAKSTSFRYRQPRSRVPSVQRQSKRGRPPDRAMSRHRRRQTQARELVGGEAALRAWEASQNLIGQLRNENHLLKERLCNCQLELRTVQRECKVQSARLSKVRLPLIAPKCSLPRLYNYFVNASELR